MELIFKSCPYMKDVWDRETARCKEYIQAGMQMRSNAKELFSIKDIGKEEYAIKSQNMDRGFYCPSLIREHVVRNAHRGKIAKRMTKVTRPTHHYLFDKDGRLRYVETYYSNGSVKPEHIYYANNVTYGIVYPTTQRNGEILISEFNDAYIYSYIWAYWELCDGKCIFKEIDLELYNYGEDGFLTVDWYNMDDMIGRYTKWRLSLNNEGVIVHDSFKKLSSEMGCLLGTGGTVTLNYNLTDRIVVATENQE